MKGLIRKLTVLMSSGMPRELVCECCGKSFSCGASLSGCWCSEIKLNNEARAELKGQFRDCLCRECLERLSVPAAKNA